MLITVLNNKNNISLTIFKDEFAEYIRVINLKDTQKYGSASEHSGVSFQLSNVDGKLNDGSQEEIESIIKDMLINSNTESYLHYLHLDDSIPDDVRNDVMKEIDRLCNGEYPDNNATVFNGDRLRVVKRHNSNYIELMDINENVLSTINNYHAKNSNIQYCFQLKLSKGEIYELNLRKGGIAPDIDNINNKIAKQLIKDFDKTNNIVMELIQNDEYIGRACKKYISEACSEL